MFSEEIPKDLSLKPNSNESEDKTNDKRDETNETTDDQMMDTNENSIDLSVKKKTIESTDQQSDKQPEEQPMELTLDLSNNSTQKANEKTEQSVNSSSLPSSDVQLSDNEEIGSQKSSNNHMNGFPDSNDSNLLDTEDETPLPALPLIIELSVEDLKRRQRKMRRLKQELRNEEMKLVLLKKLRQSQLMKENIVTTPLPQPNHPTVNHSAVKMVSNNISSRNGSVNPPLSAPNLSVGHNRSSNQNMKSSAVMNPPMGRNPSQAHGPIGPPPMGMGQRNNSSNHMPSAAHSGSLRPGPLSSMNRTPVTTPPNVVLGYPLQDLRGQPSASNSLLNSHQSLSLGANGSPGPNGSEMNQTPAQRQAAAKLALRKQLEKTLLQIPPPKPPPPEMHFIPNANNQEFVYYLGLETVVDFLTDSPNQNRPPPDPFECVQCGTDFTPVWKWQDRIDPNRDRPAVICETCVTSNIKKALKAEHTNRLKTAFVKALQQEQEIEQRIASGATSPPLPTISPPPQQTNYNGAHQSVPSSSPLVTSSQPMLPQAPPAHSSMPRLSGSAANAAAAAAAVASSAALLQQMPKLSAAHQSLFAAQAQQLHQLAQSLPQPQPAHMLPFGPLLAAQAYSQAYGMLGKSGVPSNDLHRQYLLDMIPSRSLPQGSINWKT